MLPFQGIELCFVVCSAIILVITPTTHYCSVEKSSSNKLINYIGGVSQQLNLKFKCQCLPPRRELRNECSKYKILNVLSADYEGALTLSNI